MGVLFLIWKTGLHVFRFQKIHDLLMLGEDNDYMWRVLTDEEYYEELAKRGLMEKKVTINYVYFDGKKKCREPREVNMIVEAGINERQQ